ncbi:hypothetical protein SAMN05421823_105327 [Catalinimonas alkaloidigena]|uniref:Uncharacterized protein n=1 Tax=Catalinimonas alkaloidigena TaxID=1075417 RepID=A0A1G9JIK3_9BACT|nr:hypothetical protein [Catalinimonas alkaloidigena]SDL37318.1 hypothetical protein SAMN05421823_105327 [Catalinimonas alkaloidigena]
MTPEDRLEFCRLCWHRRFLAGEGIVCGLTNVKPQFEGRCPDYVEEDYERKLYEENLFDRVINGHEGSFRSQYPTHLWWIALFSRYLPPQLTLRALDLFQYAMMGIFLFLLGVVVIVHVTPSQLHQLFVGFAFVVLAGWVVYQQGRKVWYRAPVVATLDHHGIIFQGGQYLPWQDVELAYIQSGGWRNSRRYFLKLKCLGRVEPIAVPIAAIGMPALVLTCVEAYRERARQRVS